MPSIADNLRAKRAPRVYRETINGQALRVECPDYVIHQFMGGSRCPKCKDRDWVLTKTGQEEYRKYLERRAAIFLFKSLIEEEAT